MKKAKSVATFLTAASLLFAPATVNFVQAAENSTDSTALIATQSVKKLVYADLSYVGNGGKIIGSYPILSNMQELSDKIYFDVQKAVDELNLDDDEDNSYVVSYSVEDTNDRLAKIVVTVEKDSVVNNFEYYVDKDSEQELTKEQFYKIYEQGDIDQVTTDSSLEITMVPLRSNAEKLGWTVKWEQKTETEPSKAILTKNNMLVKILVDTDTDYDLLVYKDASKPFVEPYKLDKPAQLQDSTLYVPSTLFE